MCFIITCICTLQIWNHPDVLNKFVMEHRNPLADDDLDIALDDDSRGEGASGPTKKAKPKRKVNKDMGDFLLGLDKKETHISYDWVSENWFFYPKPTKFTGILLFKLQVYIKSLICLVQAVPIMETYTHGMMENGGKMVILLSILEESLKAGDKLLVFRYGCVDPLFYLSLLSKVVVPLLVCLRQSLYY